MRCCVHASCFALPVSPVVGSTVHTDAHRRTHADTQTHPPAHPNTHAQGGWKIYVPLFVLVLIVTLILVLAPKSSKSEIEEQLALDKLTVFDRTFIPQVCEGVEVF